MDVARRWGTFILWLCGPAPSGASGGSPERVAQGLRLSPTADSPPSRRCARRLSVPPVLSYPGVPVGGQWSLGHRGCRQVGEGSGICCPGYKALQFSLPERPKRDCTCGLRPLMHPWTIGSVCHIWFQEAVSCPWARPLDRSAHGTQ